MYPSLKHIFLDKLEFFFGKTIKALTIEKKYM